jgi:hypothetical protein
MFDIGCIAMFIKESPSPEEASLFTSKEGQSRAVITASMHYGQCRRGDVLVPA